MKDNFLGNLSALRYFAASCVVLFHSAGLYDIPKWVKDLGMGNLMAFFFIMSGFIMAYSYPKFKDSRALRKYFVARFARAWPLHIATTLLALVVLPSSVIFARQPELWQQVWSVFSQITLTHTWIPQYWSYVAFNNVSWSVSVEIMFYLLFPFMITGFDKKWPKWLIGTALIIPALMIIGTVLDIRDFEKGQLLVTTTTALFHVTPYSRLVEFVLGMIIAMMVQKRGFGLGLNWSSWQWTLAEAASIVLLISGFALTALNHNWVSTLYGDPAGHWVESSGALPMVFIFLLVFIQGKGAISGWIDNRPLVILGESTYSLYLLHGLLITVLDQIGGNPLYFVPWPVQFAAVLALMTWISILSWKYFEMPSRNFLRDKLNRYLDEKEAIQMKKQTSLSATS